MSYNSEFSDFKMLHFTDPNSEVRHKYKGNFNLDLMKHFLLSEVYIELSVLLKDKHDTYLIIIEIAPAYQCICKKNVVR